LKDSFDGAKYWVKELQQHGCSDVVVTLAGNKLDLENDREVTSMVNIII